VPFTSFSEPEPLASGARPPTWFALDESRPIGCFAGVWTRRASVRKVKEGETTNDLFAFLTTEPNAEVGALHPKAMPVILRTPEEIDVWMTAPAPEALTPQKQLPDGSLVIVARGVQEDRREPRHGPRWRAWNRDRAPVSSYERYDLRSDPAS
jgi:putative SOS response-associated peptidase YedK